LALVVALFPGEDHRPLDEVQRMSPEEQLTYFVHRAAQAGLVNADDIAAGQHVFRVFQANMKATLEHRPARYRGQVTLFRAAQQQKTHDVSDDPYLGWGGLALGGVEVHDVPGDHAHMVYEPHVSKLAHAIRICL
jgi:thioesterase domain-containing protein